MSSVHLPPPPQLAHLTDSSSSNSQTDELTSIHPLQHLPELQQHQQQHQQQRHYVQPQPAFHDAQDEDESHVAHLTSVNCAVELATHGIQAFVSLYAVCSIISAIHFQAAHNFTSLTAWFLFLITGASLLVALTYILLAWWSRTSGGLDRIKTCLQAGDVKRAPAPWIIRAVVFLLSIRPRMGVILGMVASTLLASVMQQFKIRNASNCLALPAAFHHFCHTTKAAVIATFLSCFFWGFWFAYWFYMAYYKNRSRLISKLQQSRQRGEIFISMPEDDEARATKDRTAPTSEMIEAQPTGNTSTPAQLSRSQSQVMSFQQQQEHPIKESQHITQKDIQEAFQHIAIEGQDSIQDLDPNSLGLGIDMRKQLNPDSTEVPTVVNHPKRAESISGFSIGHGSITFSELTNGDGTERPRSERMRDHAKIFPRVRNSTGSIHEPYSNRNTPFLFPREMVLASPGMSPVMSTPTTSMSRGVIGYMGNQTIKALNNVPRSSSMGYIAAVNNMNANSAATSVQASPVVGASYDFGTPISARSHRSMSFLGSVYPPSFAEAAAAEQSMDERLKALRRRSFAAEAGTGSMILNMGDPLAHGPSNLSSEVDSHSRGSFKLSFSSPNLSNFRRKSSLGLKSVLNSLVNSPVSDSVSDVSSDSSSPRSILAHGGRDTDSASLSQQSNISGGGDTASVSAQDLLKLEYGEIFAALQRSHSDLTLTDLNDPLSMQSYSTPGSGAPSIISRPRSGSVSSVHTSHSTSTTKTSSSGSSSSTASTLTAGSNLTSLSGEDKMRANGGSGKLPGPPLTFMNRILVGSHHSHLHTRDNKHHHYHNHLVGPRHPHHPPHGPLRRGGSSGDLSNAAYHDEAFKLYHHKRQGCGSRSGSSTPVSRKFPSHGDLTQYSWDYRKEVCN
ncbi:hypothetical protein BGZ52_003226 [Haplosporangium bisporale]|nr:hypothetical protein BGZ52_003226 [Haplosporangium bisporale]